MKQLLYYKNHNDNDKNYGQIKEKKKRKKGYINYNITRNCIYKKEKEIYIVLLLYQRETKLLLCLSIFI